jgi:hypothetical protein
MLAGPMTAVYVPPEIIVVLINESSQPDRRQICDHAAR